MLKKYVMQKIKQKLLEANSSQDRNLWPELNENLLNGWLRLRLVSTGF